MTNRGYIFVQLGGESITKNGTIFLYFHDNVLPTVKVSDGKADF